MNGTAGPVRLHFAPGTDPAYLRRREWLVTNGLGGYASGSVAGGVTRRYHGIFVPNLPAPLGRTMLVPFVQDEVVHADRRVMLGDLELAGGRIEGDAADCLREFHLEGQVPVWRFETAGVTVERRVLLVNSQNTSCILYRLVDGNDMRLRLRPFFTFRGHGELKVPLPEPVLTVCGTRYELRLHDNAPLLHFGMHPSHTPFVIEPCPRAGVFLRSEYERGYDHVDDWDSIGYFDVQLQHDETATLFLSTEPWPALDVDPEALFEAEGRRAERLVSLAAPALRQGLAAQLVIAADQFLVFPGSRLEDAVLAKAEGGEARTVIAGYHWFTDWGRDTMVSLEGLTLATGRPREARWILRTFAHYVRDGLIPNNFPEGGRTAVYHTVDASLWYFHALDRYFDSTGDRETLRDLFPVLEGIVRHHVEGTHFGIRVDPADGLVTEGAEGYQLTWMDAKVDGWVVTPRRGKPVEIQALWYNALRLMAHWAELLHREGPEYTRLAKRARETFNRRFWIPDGSYLFDVIDGPNGDDRSFRPNQVLSLALRFPVLEQSRWKPVVDSVAKRLLTPFGLRTLDQAHQDYKNKYYGDLRARDAAYHQGTVWPWLIGPFANAWRRAHPGQSTRHLTDGLLEHLKDAGIGTISEIFDADDPYEPRGCMAQAWSVAEVLRVVAGE